MHAHIVGRAAIRQRSESAHVTHIATFASMSNQHTLGRFDLLTIKRPVDGTHEEVLQSVKVMGNNDDRHASQVT